MTNKWKDPHDNRAETAFINMPNLVEDQDDIYREVLYSILRKRMGS
mgnify:CR=1 FL=1